MNNEKDLFGNRMKEYEGIESLRKLNHSLPIICRLDGKGFSKFTQGLNRPFDVRFQKLMQETTKHLVDETNAVLGYTQSDEISLVILTKPESQPYFGARVLKLCSTLSAVCSVYFNSRLMEFLPEKSKLLPTFDCRVWNVPTLWESANTVYWRNLDCSKNSIQMAARSMFSHKSLQDLNSEQLREKMLTEKNVNWDDYPSDFKYGAFFQRVTIESGFSAEELSLLPEKHQARTNPNLLIKRSVIKQVEFPDLSTIANLPDVLFSSTPVLPILRPLIATEIPLESI